MVVAVWADQLEFCLRYFFRNCVVEVAERGCHFGFEVRFGVIPGIADLAIREFLLLPMDPGSNSQQRFRGTLDKRLKTILSGHLNPLDNGNRLRNGNNNLRPSTVLHSGNRLDNGDFLDLALTVSHEIFNLFNIDIIRFVIFEEGLDASGGRGKGKWGRGLQIFYLSGGWLMVI